MPALAAFRENAQLPGTNAPGRRSVGYDADLRHRPRTMLLKTPAAAPAQNRLLSMLPAAERKRVLERCDVVTHEIEDVLAEEGEPTKYAWFPTTGVISQVQPSEQGWIEVALVGHEGMVGVGLVIGVPK